MPNISRKSLFLPLIFGPLCFLQSCGDADGFPDFNPSEQKQKNDPTATNAANIPVEVENFIAVLQAEREKQGCSPLIWSQKLADAATAHSADMSEHRFFSHGSSNGDNPFDRIRNAGITFSRAAENIARTPTGGEHVFQLWMESSGHRKNIQNCDLTHHGVGLVNDYWTHKFMTP